MNDIVCIILAAGEGKRMRSELPKVLHKICGQAMVDYLIDCVKRIGIKRIIVVAGHKYALIKAHLKDKAELIRQSELLGTADAVRRSKSKLKGFRGDILVLYADIPLISGQTLRKLILKHRNYSATCTLLTSVVKNPTGYGRIVRAKDASIVRIIEDQNTSNYEKAIEEINVGSYLFSSKVLFELLNKIKIDKKKKELFLTDVIGLLAKRKGVRIESEICEDANEALGINKRSDLSRAEAIMRERILNVLMDKGVTIIDPTSTYIEIDVEIGRDTIIYPETYIERGVRIGESCRIGPFARIRSGTKLADGVSIGNFTELVRSNVGAKTKIKHFSYIGDATIEGGVNIGAGTVIANYDGSKKSPTFIGEGAFIGSGTILIAPVKVGRGAVTGAGSVVPAGKDVPPKTIVVGVPAKVLKKIGERNER